MNVMNIKPLGVKGTECERPVVMAGPCSAETRDQVMDVAKSLSEIGVRIFRAGIWKPRTKYGTFEGVGLQGLPWLKEVKDTYGMSIATEVASAKHVEACLEFGVDIMWIGARTTSSPFAVQAIADALKGVDVPVLVKNPVNPDVELWIGAMERLNASGVTRLGAIHRGFSLYEHKIYRNHPEWEVAIEFRRRLPEVPMFCDPSHIGGKRELIRPLSQYALDLCFDGLMIESHCKPDEAWSDARQQVTPSQLEDILESLVVRDAGDAGYYLKALRRQIDECDDRLIELLARRMSICREIGNYKKEEGITILQAGRFNDILERRVSDGVANALDAEFVRKIIEAIHSESVRQQSEILNS